MSSFLNLNKFTKENKLGQGASGKVFKVRDNSTNNIFATKISLTKFSKAKRSVIINLKREIGTLSQLNHPSVLKFIGSVPSRI